MDLGLASGWPPEGPGAVPHRHLGEPFGVPVPHQHLGELSGVQVCHRHLGDLSGDPRDPSVLLLQDADCLLEVQPQEVLTFHISSSINQGSQLYMLNLESVGSEIYQFSI